MKMSKHDRKIFNQGRQFGYAEGYAQGLHDGNPFIKIAEACQDIVKRFSDTMSDPEFQQMLLEAREMQETLEIEGEDDDSL